jgi:DNA-binding NarL/FixJ family response regulator
VADDAPWTVGLLPESIMSSSITVLIAYPKELIRAGLRSMLAGSRIKIVGEAADASSALALTKKHKPAVVLLSAAIPGGDAFGVVATLSKTTPATKIVMLSADDNPTHMARARAAGAVNCLLKDVNAKELVMAIGDAAKGKPASASSHFAKVVALMEPRENRAALDSGLTPRESQVLAHLAFGLANEEIARSLEISGETVKEHVQNLLRKLNVRDRTHAAVWAIKAGVI